MCRPVTVCEQGGSGMGDGWWPDPDGGGERLARSGRMGCGGGGGVRWRMAVAVEGSTKTSERSAVT
jgi:hypothetical protein